MGEDGRVDVLFGEGVPLPWLKESHCGHPSATGLSLYLLLSEPDLKPLDDPLG